MRYFPSFDEFAALAAGHTVVPVYRQLTGDSLTPVSAFCKVQEGDWAFLFESVVGGEKVGRYSFVGSGPFLRFEAFDRRTVTQAGRGPKQEATHPDPLAKLEELLSAYRAPHVPGLPRFCGGAVGYAGYDTVRYVEHLPNAPEDDRGLPDLSFAFYDRMVVFDHIDKTIAAVAHAHIPGVRSQESGVRKEELAASYEAACRQVDRLVERLQQGVADLQLTDIDPRGPVTIPHQSNFTPAEFKAAVVQCKEYINAGDIFQVVLSQRFKAPTRARPFDIYRALRVVNPSPFMFYVKAGPTTLVGASPEIMTRVEADLVTIRPLAGTRRRGATAEEDKALADESIADPKERAEHIM
ncbi:MAG: chorismate-binding protein, partial [Zavarzinella sp.]|nr:chorismate-binding protein [Zavarzinella sp.]